MESFPAPSTYADPPTPSSFPYFFLVIGVCMACKLWCFLDLCSLGFESKMMLCIVCNFIFMFQERCVAVDTISLVARILNRSKAHLQSMLLQSNSTVLEDFFVHLVCGILILKLQWLSSWGNCYWQILNVFFIEFWTNGIDRGRFETLWIG